MSNFSSRFVQNAKVVIPSTSETTNVRAARRIGMGKGRRTMTWNRNITISKKRKRISSTRKDGKIGLGNWQSRH